MKTPRIPSWICLSDASRARISFLHALTVTNPSNSFVARHHAVKRGGDLSPVAGNFIAISLSNDILLLIHAMRAARCRDPGADRDQQLMRAPLWHPTTIWAFLSVILRWTFRGGPNSSQFADSLPPRLFVRSRAQLPKAHNLYRAPLSRGGSELGRTWSGERIWQEGV